MHELAVGESLFSLPLCSSHQFSLSPGLHTPAMSTVRLKRHVGRWSSSHTIPYFDTEFSVTLVNPDLELPAGRLWKVGNYLDSVECFNGPCCSVLASVLPVPGLQLHHRMGHESLKSLYGPFHRAPLHAGDAHLNTGNQAWPKQFTGRKAW
jgi:hypothetical protein